MSHTIKIKNKKIRKVSREDAHIWTAWLEGQGKKYTIKKS